MAGSPSGTAATAKLMPTSTIIQSPSPRSQPANSMTGSAPARGRNSATIATWMTQLGATNVQGAAPQVRDIIEKGVVLTGGGALLRGLDQVALAARTEAAPLTNRIARFFGLKLRV